VGGPILPSGFTTSGATGPGRRLRLYGTVAGEEGPVTSRWPLPASFIGTSVPELGVDLPPDNRCIARVTLSSPTTRVTAPQAGMGQWTAGRVGAPGPFQAHGDLSLRAPVGPGQDSRDWCSGGRRVRRSQVLRYLLDARR